MSSLQSVQDDQDLIKLLEEEADEDPVVKEFKDGLTDFLSFRAEDSKMDKDESNAQTSNTSTKRRRKTEDTVSLNILTEVFLRIFYPISRCMSKSVEIGLLRSRDYSPTVLLTQSAKVLYFSENAWESFMKHLHLIECYLTNNMYGRKTSIKLSECDIEIDIVKHRGDQQVRLRDLTKHDDKIMLSREEFYVLSCAASPITRYMRQLVFSSPVIKDYLIDTMEKQPESPILYGPVDTSIFNRIPHEVELWRQVQEYQTKENNDNNENYQEKIFKANSEKEDEHVKEEVKG